MKRRVVVTGLSVCSPNGIDVEAFWANTLAGKSGVERLLTFPIAKGYTKVAGIIKDFLPETLFRLNSNGHTPDRTYLLAEYCLQNVLRDAGLDQEEDRQSCGLCISSAIGQIGSMEKAFLKKWAGRNSGNYLGAFSFNSLAGRLAERWGLRGGYLLIPTGCAGGCDSINYGYRLIKAGLADRLVVGAAEAPLTPSVVASFGRIGANSTRDCPPEEASCPFDRRRDGFVLAEGAAMLLLEAEDVAKSRRAKIVAEIGGGGSVNNCFHMTDIHPDGEAIAEACRQALAEAEAEPSEIDFVNSHGSSTPQNDVAEAAALKKVFGSRIRDIPLTSLKSQIGHALSAANAIEVVNTVKSLNESEIPPTINLEKQDPKCGVTVVANKKASHKIRKALKISSGFSGIHTATLINQYES